MSFFIAFVCWFAFAPLIVLVKQDLELTLSQIFTTNILAVAGTEGAFVSYSSDGGWMRATYPEADAMSVKLVVADA